MPHADLRKCIKEPVAAISYAARLLDAAVTSHLEGDTVSARRLFLDANLTEVREWTESIWGKGGQKLLNIRTVADAPPYIPKDERHPVRMPTSKAEHELIGRDGRHCRFCGIPLIHKRVREKAKLLYPESAGWGSTNNSQHAAFQAMWMQFDHLVPHSRGGDNSLENMVITCAPCNYGRWHYTLEEIGLSSPFDRPKISSNWDGLERLLA